jgi:hypothetical protein
MSQIVRPRYSSVGLLILLVFGWHIGFTHFLNSGFVALILSFFYLAFSYQKILLLFFGVISSSFFYFYADGDFFFHVDILILIIIFFSTLTLDFSSIKTDFLKNFVFIVTVGLSMYAVIDYFSYSMFRLDIFSMLKSDTEAGEVVPSLGPILRFRALFNEPGVLAMHLLVLLRLALVLNCSRGLILLICVLCFSTFSPLVAIAGVLMFGRYPILVGLAVAMGLFGLVEVGLLELVQSRLSLQYFMSSSGIERTGEFIDAIDILFSDQRAIVELVNSSSFMLKLFALSGGGLLFFGFLLLAGVRYRLAEFLMALFLISIKGYMFPGWLVMLMLVAQSRR